MIDPEVVPEWVRFLPNVNAALNTASAGLLAVGYRFIRRGERNAHRACMLGAFGTSAFFMASYLTYHFYPGVGTVAFVGPGWARAVYLVVLVPHIVLAGPIVPLAIVVLVLAWKGRLDRHRRWARFVLPIWLYVSVTGVLVYLMLYVFFPNGKA